MSQFDDAPRVFAKMVKDASLGSARCCSRRGGILFDIVRLSRQALKLWLVNVQSSDGEVRQLYDDVFFKEVNRLDM